MKRNQFFIYRITLYALPVVYAVAEAGMFDADARLTVTGTAPSGTLMFPFLSSAIILQYKMLIMLKTEQ